MIEKCDVILLGGGMIFTFFKAKGLGVGKSLVRYCHNVPIQAMVVCRYTGQLAEPPSRETYLANISSCVVTLALYKHCSAPGSLVFFRFLCTRILRPFFYSLVRDQ